MSLEIWQPSSGMSSISFTGKLEFRDIVIPAPGKDEWGADTLDRVVQGPASRFDKFIDGLKQGQVFKDENGNRFFLQTWRPIEHHVFPGAYLSYKGLINDALPDPLPSTTVNETVSTLTASGLDITVGGEENERIIIGGTREIKYISPTTVWRYITREEPKVRKFNSVRGGSIVDRGSVIFAQYDDGGSERYVGSAPAALATALFAQPYVDTIGPSFDPIIGTPFFECMEVCQLRYPDS